MLLFPGDFHRLGVHHDGSSLVSAVQVGGRVRDLGQVCRKDSEGKTLQADLRLLRSPESGWRFPGSFD